MPFFLKIPTVHETKTDIFMQSEWEEGGEANINF